jgi:hypothetical protein
MFATLVTQHHSAAADWLWLIAAVLLGVAALLSLPAITAAGAKAYTFTLAWLGVALAAVGFLVA